MKPEQWDKVMVEVQDQLEVAIGDHKFSMLSAFHKGGSRISISIGVEIVSEGAFSADVKTSIGYVVDRVKYAAKKRVSFDQEELPLPEATKTKRAR